MLPRETRERSLAAAPFSLFLSLSSSASDLRVGLVEPLDLRREPPAKRPGGAHRRARAAAGAGSSPGGLRGRGFVFVAVVAVVAVVAGRRRARESEREGGRRRGKRGRVAPPSSSPSSSPAATLKAIRVARAALSFRRGGVVVGVGGGRGASGREGRGRGGRRGRRGGGGVGVGFVAAAGPLSLLLLVFDLACRRPLPLRPRRLPFSLCGRAPPGEVEAQAGDRRRRRPLRRG